MAVYFTLILWQALQSIRYFVKGISFWRNCGAASVGDWYTKIWFINEVDNVSWPPYREWKVFRLWEYHERLSLGEGLMCAFLHFKLQWSSMVISLVCVVRANQFHLKMIFCFSLRRRKPSISFRSLWSILSYFGISDDSRWLVILLNTHSFIGYSWSVILYAMQVSHFDALADVSY